MAEYTGPWNFAVLDISYVFCDGGVTVVATTDIPCHLYFRWTNTPPRVHLDTLPERGYPLDIQPRYCFVTYEDNEQFESGDSLVHTFYKPTWVCGEKRWFYFHGLITGLIAVSESAIFTYTKIYKDPVWAYIAPLGPTTLLQGKDPNWHLAKTSSYFQKWCLQIISAFAIFDAINYYCNRSGFTIDTSSIPPGSFICPGTQIRLTDYVFNWWLGGGDFTAYYMAGNSWDGICDESWYHPWYYFNDVCFETYVPPLQGKVCKTLPLTAVGREALNPGGLTRYVVRLGEDVHEIPPVDFWNRYQVDRVFPGCEIRLEVKYCAPC